MRLSRRPSSGHSNAEQSSTLTVPRQFQADIQLAQAGVQHYMQQGDWRGLDEAAAAWEHILQHPTFTSAPERFQLVVYNNSGGVFLHRYWAQGQIADLNRALQLWMKAVQQTPPNSPDRAVLLNNLGIGLSDRYVHSGQLDDLEAAVTTYQDAVRLTPPNSPNRASRLNSLGSSLRNRYVRSGQLADLEAAITAWNEAVQRTLPDSPDRAALLNNLGIGLRDRYTHSGQLDDLEAAITVWNEAMQRTPPNSPNRVMYLTNLGNGLRDRYTYSGQLDDLEAAVTAYQDAARLTPPNSPDYATLLNNLGIGLRDRYTHSGQLDNLEAAIAAWNEAVQRTPPNSPNRAMYLTNLGNGLSDRYTCSGQLDDLEAAVTAYQDAARLTPPNSSNRAMYLTNLGNGLRDRYTRRGELTDLNEAVAAFQEAVHQTPPGSPNRASRLNNLGNGLYDRYVRNGRLGDLESAIAACNEAVQRTPPDSINRAMYLTNLGSGLSHRYTRSDQLADLEAAVTAFQDAVRLTPSDSPNRASRLNSLGNGLRNRYVRSGQLADLEAAITTYQDAVQRTPLDSPNRGMYLNGLGIGLHDRYAHSGQLDDLEAAITTYQDAVGLMPPDSSNRAMCLNNLGDGLRDRYAHSGELADLDEATRVYRMACQLGLQQHREIALVAACNWGTWALAHRTWPEATEAYQYGLDALEQLYRVQILRQSRQSWQKAARNLIVTAAYAQARSRQFVQAILTLEQGRTRQLNERLARDQAQLEDLAAEQTHLVEHYQQLTDQLHQLETTERQQTASSTQTPDWTQHRQRVQATTTQLDNLIEQIRQVPGYERFFSPVSWDTVLASLQPDTPLLYLLTTEVGSLGLLVQATPDNQGVVTPIWLDNFTVNALNNFLVKRVDDTVVGGYLPGQLGQWRWLREALRDGLPQLGENLLAPIAQRLHQKSIKQFVVISTGLLNLIPLHAASYTVDGRTEILGDAFCVTYAPSAQSLAYSRQELASQSTQSPTLLSVGDPQPVSAKPLVFSRHEASEIMGHFPERGELLLTTNATLTTVQSRLGQANYVHLSCHGLFDPENPLQSGLLFSHDAQLTLADLLDEMNLAAARLVVLSACQTAITDFNDLPDEVIGLPAGFLQAGVPGVIGTLWPVNDHSTALLMGRFYSYHMGEGLHPAAALQKSQHWLRNATRQEIGDYYKSFIRMSAEEASDLHWEIRKEGKPDDRPYEHPYYWAAFAFYGA